MWFPGRIKQVAKVDIQPALDALNRQDESVWFADEETKKYLAGDRPTQSLFFYSITREEYVATLSQRPLEQSDVAKLQAYDLLYKDFAYLFDFVQQYYPPGGIFLRAQIARMPPGGTIGEHRDSLMILENAHRLHIPIVTTPKLKFMVDEERVVLKAGYLYELNNQLSHWVKNPPNSINRIHLILDYLPPEYNVPASTDENFKFFIREHRVGRPQKPSDLKIDPPKVLALVANPAQNGDLNLALYAVDFKDNTTNKVFDLFNPEAGEALLAESNSLAGVAVTDTGIAVVAGNKLHLLSGNYQYEEAVSSPLLNKACAVASESHYLYIASQGIDSIVRFDMRKKNFDTVWRFYVDESRKIAVAREEVDVSYNVSASNLFEFNSIKVQNGTLYVSGKNLSNLLVVGEGVAGSGEQLPQFTSTALSFNKGMAFINPVMQRVAYIADHDYRVVRSDALTGNGAQKRNFSRGLCRYQKGTLLAGLQPAGVALLDMKNQSLISELSIEQNESSFVLDLDLIG